MSNLQQLKNSCGYPGNAIIEKLEHSPFLHVCGREAGNHMSKKTLKLQIKMSNTNKPTILKPLCHSEVSTLRYNLPSVLVSNVTSLSCNLDSDNSHQQFVPGHKMHKNNSIPTCSANG